METITRIERAECRDCRYARTINGRRQCRFLISPFRHSNVGWGARLCKEWHPRWMPEEGKHDG